MAARAFQILNKIKVNITFSVISYYSSAVMGLKNWRTEFKLEPLFTRTRAERDSFVHANICFYA